MNSHLGIMTTIAILSALLADFLFLPPLLMKLEERKNAPVEVDGPVVSETA